MSPSEYPAPSATLSSAPVRVASLLPGLTDVVQDLHLSHLLVACSHECTASPAATRVTTSSLPTTSTLSAQQIASGWNASLSTHPFHPDPLHLLSTRACSFYHLNIPVLTAAAPTVLLTHLSEPRSPTDPAEHDLRVALQRLFPRLNTILSVHARSLCDVYELHHAVAAALAAPDAAVHPVASARARLRSISLRAPRIRRSVAVVQWTAPLFLAGDWVPGATAAAGAKPDALTREGGPSVCVSPGALRGVDVLVFALCAVGVDACRREAEQFWEVNRDALHGWGGLCVVTDATVLFSRPSLSAVVMSAEVVADVLRGEDRFGHKGRLWETWTPQSLGALPGEKGRHEIMEKKETLAPVALRERGLSVYN